MAGDYTGGAITIPAGPSDFAAASPYPSTVTASGEKAIVTQVRVRISGFTHPFPDEVDFLLVGPSGRTVVLLSDGGTSGEAQNQNMTIDDSALAGAPDPLGGTFRPTDMDDGDTDLFPSPAPAGPFGSSLSALAQPGADGNWSLYVMDDSTGDGGSITSWQLSIRSRDPLTVGAYTEQLPPPFGWSEGVGSVRVLVERLATSALHAGAVGYATIPWGASGSSVAPTPGQDYLPVSGRFEWGAGESGVRTIDIPIVDDSVFEPQESFLVRLSDPAGDLALPRPHELLISISDDDPGPPPPPSPVLRAHLRGAAVQRVLKQRGVRVTASSNVNGTVTATGRIAIPGGAGKVVRLKRAQRRVTAGNAVKLKLGLSTQALRAVRRALSVKKKLKATVRLILKVPSGRQATVAKKLTLKR